MREKWKDVVGYVGFYKVSNLGRVMGVKRAYINKLGHNRTQKQTILKPSLDGGGYLKVNLYIKGKPKSVSVHILVAKAFINNPDNKPIVNHKNGVKTDNTKSNLEWVTDSGNKLHAINTGLTKMRGEDNPSSKLSCDQVLLICDLLDEGVLSQAEIAIKFRTKKYTISSINLGVTWNYLTNRKGKIAPKNMKGKNHPRSTAIINCRGEVFDSITKAAESYKITKSSILHNLKGASKTSGRYPDGIKIRWEYYKGANDT